MSARPSTHFHCFLTRHRAPSQLTPHDMFSFQSLSGGEKRKRYGAEHLHPDKRKPLASSSPERGRIEGGVAFGRGPTRDQRSDLMERIDNVGREVHLRTLRFGSRLIAGTAIAGDADAVTGSGPAASQQAIAGNRSPSPARSNCAGFTRRPPGRLTTLDQGRSAAMSVVGQKRNRLHRTRPRTDLRYRSPQSAATDNKIRTAAARHAP
jgi:hypothetical protein